MSLEDQDWTRSPAFRAETDIHPNLGTPEFGEIVERDSELARNSIATQTELSAHAEIMQDEVLQAMGRAQTTALREAMVAVDPALARATDEVITEQFFALQLSDPNRALTVMNNSISGAATLIEAQGYTSTTLAAAISRAVSSAGQNLNGAVTDLSSMSTQGLLTIAGVGFGSFILSGRPGVGIAMGGLATVIQSSHLTDLTLNVGAGVLRGATQAVALPIRGAMRTTDIINGLGQDGLLQNIQANARGFGNDVINSIAYTFDDEYTPQHSLDNNVLLREFYEQGEVFAPLELRPFVVYLKEFRNGGPITNLPTEAEARTAGAFIRRIENLVTADEFTVIQEKRISGTDLTPEENRKYILYKYCMIVNHSFFGDEGMPPYAEAFTNAYNAETTTISIDQAFASLSPTDLAALETADFTWTPEQVAAFEHNIEGMDINFENLCKNGFVGCALTAYLALTYGLMMIEGVKGAYNAQANARERAAAKRRMALDDRTLSNSQRSSLTSALSSRENQVAGVVSALVGSSVLANNSEFDRTLRQSPLENFGQEQYNALLTLAEDDTATKGAIRTAFFNLIESNTTLTAEQQESMAARRDFYTYRDALNRIDNFYKYDPRGRNREIKLGGDTFTIGRPERGDFRFTTVSQLAQISNPRNFYRYMTNGGDGRTLRMRNPDNREVYLQIRRSSAGEFQYNARDGEGWQNFNLNEFANSVVNEEGSGSDEAATA